jgi:nitroreductase
MKTFKQLLQQRTSVSRYQAGNPLDASVIEDLIEQAALAPSAYNLQNWRFIAVSSDGQKQALHQAAYQQPQILDAATTIIVIGTLNAHQALPEVLQLSVDAGIMPDNVAQGWVAAATSSHQHDPQVQRDEAIRSASMAAMNLMLAATDMGIDNGAMGGFDAEQLAITFNLSDNDVPVMLITLGKASEQAWSQKVRRPVADLLQQV